MNKRLHELMRQARSRAYDNACAKNKTQRPQNNTIWNEFPEVFAELIVRECADTVLGFNNQFGDSAHNEIREHFGVEE